MSNDPHRCPIYPTSMVKWRHRDGTFLGDLMWQIKLLNYLAEPLCDYSLLWVG